MPEIDDTTTPTAPNREAQSPQELVAAGLSELRSMFETITLVPEGQIEDYLGNSYRFPVKLKGRKAIRAVLALWDVIRGTGAKPTPRGIYAFLHDAVVSDEADDELQKLFELLHPGILRDAQEAAKAAGEAPDECVHVLDLFEVDQVFEGLLPFLILYAVRLAAAWSRSSGQSEERDPARWLELSRKTQREPSERSSAPLSGPATT